MLAQYIRKILKKILKQLDLKSTIDFLVWIPLNSLQNTDVSTNLVMVLAAKRQQPLELVAKTILAKVDYAKHHLEDVKLDNGYLNFTFTNDFRNQIIDDILQKKDQFGKTDLGKGKRLNYEWISANPTGYLHLGHARNAILGMALSNLLEFVNYQVTREFYVNDQGNQIFNLGKSIYYKYKEFNDQKIKHKDTEIYINKEIDIVAKKFTKKYQNQFLDKDFFEDKEIQNKFIDFAKQFFLKKIKKDCQKLNINFDKWFLESDLYKPEYKNQVWKTLLASKLIYEKDGASWIKLGTKEEPDDYVLIKKTGEPTYFYGDLMYHMNKFDRKFDICIDLWGADHHGHYKKVKKGLELLQYPSKNYIVNLMQMVKIVRGNQILKMSKRSGTAYYLHDLLDEIGGDFIKFMLLSSSRNNRFVFNIDLVKNKQTNPLYYCQYAYARACQLLNKSTDNVKKLTTYDQLIVPAEKKLILTLHQFDDKVIKTINQYEPFVLIEYVTMLSKNFHYFYEKCMVNNLPDIVLKHQRLMLIKAFKQVFKNIFKLFSIKTPEKM